MPLLEGDRGGLVVSIICIDRCFSGFFSLKNLLFTPVEQPESLETWTVFAEVSKTQKQKMLPKQSTLCSTLSPEGLAL